jgi:hypothetical protein
LQEAAAASGIHGRDRVVALLLAQGVIALGIWYLQGPQASEAAEVTRVLTALAPFLIFPVFFVWKLTTVPALLAEETSGRNAELSGQLARITDKQAWVDVLSDLLSEGIHEIWNGTVTNDAQMEALQQYWVKWCRDVEEVLREKFTHSDLIHFSRLGVVPIVVRRDAFDNHHEKILREYALKEQRLREIIRAHNVTKV